VTREASTQPAPVPAIRNRIVFITTVPETVSAFLANQIRGLLKEGFEVHTISSPPREELRGKLELCGINHELAMRRTMSPLHDLPAVVRLYRLLRALRPQIVHTHTPKAGLLGMIAARLVGVPVRIYTINGLPILTQPLWARVVLAVSEHLTCTLATEVLCVSRSVRRFVIASGFCRRAKCRTLGDGGSHGVDLDKFNPSTADPRDRSRIREQYGIPENAVVLGYIGRIVPDKGVAELSVTWNILREQFPELRLLLCGYSERDHPLLPGMIEAFRSDPRVHFTAGLVTNMPAIYAAIDICVLPSYREGLSNVALECGAMEVPIVATRVQGCVDAIQNGVTGLLVAPRDPEALAQALRRLIANPDLRKSMGVSARKFIGRRFSEARISRLLLEEYAKLVNSQSQAGPIRSFPPIASGLVDPETEAPPIPVGLTPGRACNEIPAGIESSRVRSLP
jgi:glycosyltransferase involved in cell wall biosynthesis